MSSLKGYDCSKEKVSDTARQRETGFFDGLTTTDRTLSRLLKSLTLFKDKPAFFANSRINAKRLPLLLKTAANML